MTPTKLSDSEKQEIIELYRDTEENTVTLADRYGVSSSTVRRILQNGLPTKKYKALVQQKQKRSLRGSKSSNEDADIEEAQVDIQPEEELSPFSASTFNAPQRRRRPSYKMEVETQSNLYEKLTTSEAIDDKEVSDERLEDEYLPDDDLEEIMADELLIDRSENLEEFVDRQDEDLEEFSEEDEEFEQDIEAPYSLAFPRPSQTQVEILPLSEAVIPQICYLVIDRCNELVTAPLMAFGDIGQIPSEESQEKTLPVFDNHRVAKRFSARNQRVLKVPDGKMLKKAATQLQAKGISRLLIEGQVYRF